MAQASARPNSLDRAALTLNVAGSQRERCGQCSGTGQKIPSHNAERCRNEVNGLLCIDRAALHLSVPTIYV
jgi:DnaJ-class molecular chaperone